MKIGLAHSGGGFRASLYHLGLIRFLRDAEILSQVSGLSGHTEFIDHARWGVSNREGMGVEDEQRSPLALIFEMLIPWQSGRDDGRADRALRDCVVAHISQSLQ